jgi:hypothetical protein
VQSLTNVKFFKIELANKTLIASRKEDFTLETESAIQVEKDKIKLNRRD